MIECFGEGEYFPESEFERDAQGNMVHKRGEPHYVTGIPVRKSAGGTLPPLGSWGDKQPADSGL